MPGELRPASGALRSPACGAAWPWLVPDSTKRKKRKKERIAGQQGVLPCAYGCTHGGAAREQSMRNAVTRQPQCHTAAFHAPSRQGAALLWAHVPRGCTAATLWAGRRPAHERIPSQTAGKQDNMGAPHSAC